MKAEIPTPCPTVVIPPGAFVEDKHAARVLQETKIVPALLECGRVKLDFIGVEYVTQGFIHALLAEPMTQFGIERFEFLNCSVEVRAVIELAVDFITLPE